MPSPTSSKRRLVIAIIARNAAEPLAETLVSIRNLADEIVVLDTGSTDETPSIAEKLGATVHHRPWDDSFATARNGCLTHISADWVLWLDAGERLKADEVRLLREFIDEHADVTTAYLLRVGITSPNQQCSGEQIACVRLHPNRPGLHFSGRVRETMERSLFAFGMKLEHLPIIIERSAREYDQQYKAEKARRNIHLADLQIAERGPSAELMNCLGEATQTLGQHEQALQHYQWARELAEPASKELLEANYGLLTCLQNIGEHKLAAEKTSQNRAAQLSICMEAIASFPLDAQLLCAMAGYLQSMGQPELAARSYSVAYQHGQIEPEIWHLPDIREVAATSQAALLQLAEKDDEALALLTAAWNAYPSSLRIGRQVVELHVKYARRDEALLAVSKLPSSTPARETWRAAVQGACAAAKGNWVAAQGFLETAYRGGCHERFCLRWLCVTLLAAGKSQEAQGVLTEWRQFDGDNPELAQFMTAISEGLATSGALEATGSATQPLRPSHSSASENRRVDPPQDTTLPGAPKRRAGTGTVVAGTIPQPPAMS